MKEVQEMDNEKTLESVPSATQEKIKVESINVIVEEIGGKPYYELRYRVVLLQIITFYPCHSNNAGIRNAHKHHADPVHFIAIRMVVAVIIHVAKIITKRKKNEMHPSGCFSNA